MPRAEARDSSLYSLAGIAIERDENMFDDEFVKNLPEEVLPAARKIKAKFDASDTSISKKERPVEAYYNAYIKAYGLLQAFSNAKNLDIQFPELADDKIDGIAIIRQAFLDLGGKIAILEKNKAQDLLENTIFHFKSKFSGTFLYEFSEGDVKKVHVLMKEMRERVSENTELGDAYSTRLLNRFEKLQAEIEKEVSSLDTFWGFIGEAGVIIGKLGNNSDLFVDHILKMSEIIWRTQARAEDLPSGLDLPLLSKEG